jgi:amino-acid N-acetyltransferase
MRVRRARVADAAHIHGLVNSLSHDGTLLRRAFGEICENVRDFFVAEDDYGNFCGCGALHIYGPHLAEVRSIVVMPEMQATGAGGKLLHALMAEADEHQIPSVCCFTRIPEFFSRHGFQIAERDAIPDKIRKDCIVCPRFHACDEVAMVRGPLPLLSLAEYESGVEPALVQLAL